MENEVQMQINLNKSAGNDFRQALRNGEFIFLSEALIPPGEKELAKLGERIVPFAEKMWSFTDLHGGVAVPDHFDAAWSAADIAAVFPREQRSKNIFFISGSGRSLNSCRDEMTVAANNQAMNIVPVSGNAAPFTLNECRNRDFTGSVTALETARENGNFFTGAVFNPYHYTLGTLQSAFSNLEQKIAAGAEYIIVQAGWDMLQLQALRWYLIKRKLCTPLIARLQLLSPAKVEKIAAGNEPGMRISGEFLRQLEHELRGSRAQFDSAQYRRLEIQIAGCRLMGYSGVLISGVDFPGTAEIIAARVRSALEEFSSFEQWLDEYTRHHGGAEMNNASLSDYRLYDRFIYRDYPIDDPPEEHSGDARLSRWDKISYAIRKWLFAKSGQLPASRDKLLKNLFTGCPGCDQCTLAQNEFVCIAHCPKHLQHGPCGGVQLDGKCEIGDFECPFVKKARIYHWRNIQKNLES